MATLDDAQRGDRVRLADARLPLVILGFVLLLGATGLYVVDAAARDGLRGRIALRTQAGAEFIGAQTRDILDREETLARQYLSGPRVSTADFERASHALALDAAVLLDDQGRLLHVLPQNRTIIGNDMTQYPHLGAAVRTGRPAVSPVVASAALGVPVVGFAVPFSTARGRRVFSGALDVQKSALGQYLRTAVRLPGAESYLVDENGGIVATGAGKTTTAATFAEARPSFAQALARGEDSADLEGRHQFITAFAVPGTTWTLLVATPDSVAFAPAPSRSLLVAAWLLLALVGAAAAATATLSRTRRRQWLTANARLRSTFDNPLVGMLLTAADGSLISANNTFCELVGRRGPDLVGRTFAELTHPDDRQVSADRMQALLAGQATTARFDKRYVRPDGRVVHAALTTNLVRDPSGHPDYFTTQVVDVTRQRAAEEARAVNLTELKQRTKELEVANAGLTSAHMQVSDLMSMVSHDVRQPLVAIRGFSEVVLEDWSTLSEDQRLGFVTRIARAGETAQRMLEDSLTTTAIQGGGVVPRPTAVSLSAAARDVVDHLTADRSAVTVRGPEKLAAQVDRGHFVQVLTNLLTNAVKYGAPPIQVECAPKGADRVVVCVTDQGEGIPADFVPQLFKRYTRAEAARSSMQRGTGLGLYIARALIEANGGTIDYQRSPQGGGSFVITLPAAKAD